jgi:hypothetical protein
MYSTQKHVDGKKMPRQITSVYQLKIVLEDVRPQIMRRVLVPADIPLNALHEVLQVAMGWTDSHLHSFAFGEREFTAHYEEGDLEELDMEDERGVPLSGLITAPKATFTYQYDFGDNWQHIVTLEKVLPPDPNSEYPVCLAGKRACPPDDCGGTWGYAGLLKVLRDPTHPEYRDMRTWVGRKFDSELFDLEKVNKTLRQLRKWV